MVDMDMPLTVRVLTPDRIVCATFADEAIVPGLTGQVGVLAGHATLITAIHVGVFKVKVNEKWTPIIVSDGLAEVDRNRVTVLINDVEEVQDIKLSVDQASKEVENAVLAIEKCKTNKSLAAAYKELLFATARLEVLNLVS